VKTLCQITGLNRADFYRRRVPRQVMPLEMEIRDQMQKIALESPAYGYRRITSELQQSGIAVNHKRVLRMMHQDNLLCVRGRAFVITTDSRHNLPIYPNLAREIKPTGINQLWVSDITYIRLRTEFVYLAVVLDAFSRRVIGWALGRTLEAGLAVTALRMARHSRKAKRNRERTLTGTNALARVARCRGGHSPERALQQQIDKKVDFETFFGRAPRINPNASKITGVICGYRVEEIEDKLMQQIRYLDKLVDELAKGKAMDKILRK